METKDKTKAQLLDEVVKLRQQVAKLEKSETEYKQAIEVLEQHNRELIFLSQTIQALISTLQVNQVLDAFLEGVRQCLNVAACSVWLMDPETNSLVCRKAIGPQSELVLGWRLVPGEGLAGWVAHSGKSLIVSDTRTDKRHFGGVNELTGLELRSIMSVPLRVTGQGTGTLHVLDTKVNRFDKVDLALLESLAAIAAVAIENAQLYQQAQQEIFERQRTEFALRESEERFRQVIISISAHIYVTEITKEGDAVNLYLSPDVEPLTGYPYEEFMADRNFWPSVVIHPEDKSAAAAHAAQLALGQDGEIEYRLIKRNGDVIWVHDSARVEYNGPSKIIYGVVSDITKRKQLEEQLYQAQKMEAIGVLAGGIAHNFNNLMTIINGYGELAQDQLGDNDALRYDIEQIRKAAKRAASLTRQLLDFSRKQILQPQIIDLNTVVLDIDLMLQPIIGKNIDLIITMGEGLGQVKADPGRIEQVILNLVINARDAMGQGGKLTIETARVDLDEAYAHQHVGVKPGSYVMLAVSDTGHGMDEATRSRIFEPFFTTKEEGRGTGLGLATVHGIIKQSGGHVQVYSEVGQGTTFKIYLPNIEDVADIDIQNQAPVESLQGSEVILLVEDEQAIRKLAEHILLDHGYTVLATHQGPEALQLFKDYNGQIHLLITDVVLQGGLSGPELAKQIALPSSKTKVLYMSGYPDKTVARHQILPSEVPFLEKPFTPDTLLHKVREVLNEK